MTYAMALWGVLIWQVVAVVLTIVTRLPDDARRSRYEYSLKWYAYATRSLVVCLAWPWWVARWPLGVRQRYSARRYKQVQERHAEALQSVLSWVPPDMAKLEAEARSAVERETGEERTAMRMAELHALSDDYVQRFAPYSTTERLRAFIRSDPRFREMIDRWNREDDHPVQEASCHDPDQPRTRCRTCHQWTNSLCRNSGDPAPGTCLVCFDAGRSRWVLIDNQTGAAFDEGMWHHGWGDR